MRPRIGLIGALVLVSLLAACATSRDTIVLLPKADGSTGAIAASRGGKEVLLDSPYASATSGAGGRLKSGSADRATVDKKFGDALAAMPPAPKIFTVYFLSGSDELTAESSSEIELMFAEMRERPAPEVTVIGHTDRVGSDADNDALSLQRAQRVKDMLITMGVPPDQIRAVGRGSREPLIATAAGVDEQENRRVEVSVR
jgi:OOP family OmpA-OmpF porin